MTFTILSWLLGSKIGRYAVIAGLVVAAACVAVWMIRADERRKIALANTLKTLETLQSRIATDEEIATLSRADRIERLRQWSR